MSVLQVRNLHKFYGDFEAVRGVDFEIHEGQTFALLGPNGAGKTTTVEILEGYRAASGGEVRVLGFDPARHSREFRARVGIVPQQGGFDRYLTVSETIDLYRRYYPAPLELDQILDLVGLCEKAGSRVQKLSGGQQRRLDIALAIAGDPDLLFLDEPTTGFDPQARRQAWKMLEGLAERGKTILLTTHYLDEAQHLAERVAVIDRGKIIAEGTPESLTQGHRTQIKFRVPPKEALPDWVRSEAAIDGRQVELPTDTPTETLYRLTSWAHDQSLQLDGLTVTSPTLEDVYLELVDDSHDEHEGGDN